MANRVFRRALGALVALLLVLGITILTGSPSQAEDGDTNLYGVIKAPYAWSEGIPDLEVRVYRATGIPASPWTLDQTVYTHGGVKVPDTEASIGYFYAPVDPGTYRVTVNEFNDGTPNWQKWTSAQSGSIVVTGTTPDEYIDVNFDPLQYAGGQLGVQVVDQCNDGIGDATIDSFVGSGPPDEPMATTTSDFRGEADPQLLRSPTKVKVTGPAEAVGTTWVGGGSSFADAEEYYLGPGQYFEPPSVKLTRTVFEQPSPGQLNPLARGVVFSPDGEQLAGVSVRFYRKTVDPEEPWHLEATAVTGNPDPAFQGNYSVRLPVGEYRMTVNEINDGSAASKPWAPYFHQGTSFDTSAPFCATASMEDVWLPETTLDFRGRHIQGRITNARGIPISGATVETYDEDGSTPARSTITNSNGEYTTHGKGDTVKLRITPNQQYLPEWFNDATHLGTAAEIDSSPGATSTGNNVELRDAQPTFDGRTRITGTAQVGKTLTAVAVTSHDNAPGFTKTYKWFRTKGRTTTAISGATLKTYKPTTADVGARLTVRVTITPPTPAPGIVADSSTSFPWSYVMSQSTGSGSGKTAGGSRITSNATEEVDDVAHSSGDVKPAHQTKSYWSGRQAIATPR